VNTHEKAIKLNEVLSKNGFLQIDLVHSEVSNAKLTMIEEKWALHDGNGDGNGKRLVMICEQNAVDFIDIETAECVVHYDFPTTKTAFGKRLWFMRRFFSSVKQSSSSSNDRANKSRSSDGQQTDDDDDEKTQMKIELKNENLFVDDDRERLCSYIFLKKTDLVHSLGLYNFLIRTGLDESKFPTMFKNMVKACRASKENENMNNPLCPYLNSFGSCMDANPSSCVYRHVPNKRSDEVYHLDTNMKIPSEGFVRVSWIFELSV
jgi:hypothetical protein